MPIVTALTDHKLQFAYYLTYSLSQMQQEKFNYYTLTTCSYSKGTPPFYTTEFKIPSNAFILPHTNNMWP